MMFLEIVAADCPPAAVRRTCSTAEHCQEMVRQLAKALAARLEPPLGEKVRHCSHLPRKLFASCTAPVALLN